MKKLLLTSGFSALAATRLFSATTLAGGDLLFVGYNSDNTDSFGFITLVTLTANTEIVFTDNAYQGGGDGSGEGAGGGTWRNTEGTLIWDSGSTTIDVGTVITWDSAAGFNLGTSSGTAVNLSANGDQILAYQGSITGGILTGSVVGGIQGNSGMWDASGTNSNTSVLPSAIGGSGETFVIDPETDNAAYTGSRSFASPAELRAAVSDVSNWSLNNSTNQTISTAPFSVPEPSTTLILGLGALGLIRRNRR